MDAPPPPPFPFPDYWSDLFSNTESSTHWLTPSTFYPGETEPSSSPVIAPPVEEECEMDDDDYEYGYEVTDEWRERIRNGLERHEARRKDTKAIIERLKKLEDSSKSLSKSPPSNPQIIQHQRALNKRYDRFCRLNDPPPPQWPALPFKFTCGRRRSTFEFLSKMMKTEDNPPLRSAVGPSFSNANTAMPPMLRSVTSSAAFNRTLAKTGPPNSMHPIVSRHNSGKDWRCFLTIEERQAIRMKIKTAYTHHCKTYEDLMEAACAIEEELLHIAAPSRLDYFKSGFEFENRVKTKVKRGTACTENTVEMNVQMSTNNVSEKQVGSVEEDDESVTKKQRTN